MIIRCSLLTILISCFQLLISAQELIVPDTSSVEIRNFETAKIDAYKADADFQYNRIAEPAVSLWDRFWQWFWAKVRGLLSSELTRNGFNTVLVLLAIGVLVMVILKIMGMNNAGLFGKKNKAQDLDYSTVNENIHFIDFDVAIQQAIDDRNFRFAVRLLYLQSLKNLTDRQLINWQINKTNVSYVQELANNSHQQVFRHLTFQFECNWYGDLPIEEAEFSGVRDQFSLFNRQIQQ